MSMQYHFYLYLGGRMEKVKLWQNVKLKELINIPKSYGTLVLRTVISRSE
jgi:hypothetical protein